MLEFNGEYRAAILKLRVAGTWN